MNRIKCCLAVFIVIFLLTNSALTASEKSSPSDTYTWGLGISAISPGLPIAVKAVYGYTGWGVQLECNYFYQWGMARLDGRRTVFTKPRLEGYAFAGITTHHFNDMEGTTQSIENILSVDLGIGAELRPGRKGSLGLGAEGGLMVPFYSSKDLDDYSNDGFIVANIYFLVWF